MAPKKKEMKGTKRPVEEIKRVAVVVEMSHGPFFKRHKHYMVNVIEVSKAMPTEKVGEAMSDAIEEVKKMSVGRGVHLEVLTAEEIIIHTKKDVQEKSSALHSAIAELLK